MFYFKGIKSDKKFLSLALASVLSCGIVFAADNYTTDIYINKGFLCKLIQIQLCEKILLHTKWGRNHKKTLLPLTRFYPHKAIKITA
ncbi:hypothetical protein [Helicobacter turcicus]|uniref:Uncharacterized protein n=1 Tax=Helicobacter turcicus TaxID=2867412 RepID=A0ABS7JQ51_9HELI|nr:hypothetical protein [Helicobacter turcicus]MBX7491529.1 hypothetical protein [Helicobacter turcicus]MBX7546385.1 hypothetical protein [Helicobacter turcicus]